MKICSGSKATRMIPDLIYDLGLHTGQDTAFYLKKGFRVVAIEASPLLVNAAKDRFASEVATGQLTLLNVGIGEAKGRFPFYVHLELSEWSSFDFDIGTKRGAYEVIQVEMISLADVLREFGVPYYAKIDIEGMDLAALKSLHNFPDRPKFVSAENGPPEMLHEMVTLGYSTFKFINQQPISTVHLPHPSKEGRDIDWTFPFGSSGPFGEETAGDWISADEVLRQINEYWGNPNRDANVHGWFDLHARLPD
jgi:FkbM family methyltransferase